jgi:exosome complex RNA-binding protein Rrp42 (RNase PH superfamily)
MSILKQSKKVAEFIQGMNIQNDLEECIEEMNVSYIDSVQFSLGDFKLMFVDPDTDEGEVIQIQILVTRDKSDFVEKEVSNG